MYLFTSNSLFLKGFLTSLWICFVTSVAFSFKMNNRHKRINPYLASFGFCNAVADWPHCIWFEIVITGFSRNCSASLWFNGVGDHRHRSYICRCWWWHQMYSCSAIGLTSGLRFTPHIASTGISHRQGNPRDFLERNSCTDRLWYSPQSTSIVICILMCKACVPFTFLHQVTTINNPYTHTHTHTRYGHPVHVHTLLFTLVTIFMLRH